MNISRIILAALVILAALTSAPSFANDQDIWSTTVPASSCQPANSIHLAKVTLSNGAWVFRGNNTGTVAFYCPLPVNAFTKSDFSNDNDISRFRVYYRDTDGMGLTSRVTARLTYRRSDGSYVAGSTWSSDNFANNANTTRLHTINHDVRANALYAFYVTLRRTSNAQSPAFSGIDFNFPSVP